MLYNDFSTAQDILDRRKNLLRCTTGSAKLDSFLKGGIESQAITEIAGEFGSGKSQICYTLCVTAKTPLDRKGLGVSATARIAYVKTSERTDALGTKLVFTGFNRIVL